MKVLLTIFLLFCSTQLLYSQEEDGVVSLDLPVRNSLKFNRSIINPTFSFVREQNKYVSIYNKREWGQFENAPLTYMVSYSGRFRENIGIGVSAFQQNYGVLTTFGGILNFAYNIQMDRESNLTFGLNLGFHKSGLNSGKVITNVPDPSLENIPSNFLLTANPGINYGTAFVDFGLSLKNLVQYNLNTSELIEEDPEQSIQAHILYTGYMDAGGFFYESKFSGLLRAEFKNDATVFSGAAMLTIPKGIWAQIGYNTLYGPSVGLGLNISSQIAVEYNYEKAIGDLSNFGPSHDITLAYRFKNRNNYYYSGNDEESASIIPRPRKVKRPATKPALNANARAELAAKKAKEEADKQAAADAAAEAQRLADEKAAADAAAEAQRLAEEKAAAEAQRLADENAAADETAEAQRLADEKAAADAAAEAQRLADEKAAADAAAEAQRLADEKAAADTAAEAQRLAEEKAAADTAAEAQRLADEKAAADTAAEAQRLADEKAAADAAAEAQRLADEKAAADAAAEAQRLADEKAAADAAAEAQRLADEKAAADTAAEAQRLADEKAAADAAAEAQRLADEKAAADAAAEAQRLADEKAAADAAAEAQRLADEKAAADAAAEAQRLADEKAAADAAAEAQRLADEKAAADAAAEAQRLADEKAAADAAAEAQRLADEKAAADAAAEAQRLADEKAAADAAAEAQRLADEKAAADAAAEAQRLADEKAAADAAAEAQRLADEKAAADAAAEAQRLADEKAAADAAAEAQRLADEKAAADAAAEAQRLADEKAAADAAAEAQRLADEKAAADAAAEAQRLADEKAAADAAAEAQRLADEKAAADAAAEAQRLADEKAAADAAAEAQRLALNPTDELGISLSTLAKSTENSKIEQAELLTRLKDAVDIKNKDLEDLREENDLSEKGIYKAPTAFKSVTAEKRALRALETELDGVIAEQNKKIEELEGIYDKRLKKVSDKNDPTNRYYQEAIQTLKTEQLEVVESRRRLLATLEDIKVALEIERKRRIKRAAYDNEQDRFVRYKAALQAIKQNTPLSPIPLKAEDFDFGEEQSDNIQILKNVTNVDDGYYLIIAVHSNVAKRDDFLTKAVASGESNIDFFHDVNTSKYYIYYSKFDTLRDANNEMKSKGNKPYNGKMSIVKIEN